ncbi:hypothetical protein K9L16_03265 [Candidatus Pacearchaeota archaeon]|nr:hypothetical protein [Candidatus Pacearchaeota archaeon]
MNRKGISGVIVTVMMVGLAILLVAVVWASISSIVDDNLKKSSSCFEIFDKINFNRRYTCYNSSDNVLQFSVSVGDVKLDKLFFSVESASMSRVFEITNNKTSVENIGPYPSGSGDVKIPDENSGRTYILNLTGAGFIEAPSSIQVYPEISGEKCQASDSILQIDDCIF